MPSTLEHGVGTGRLGLGGDARRLQLSALGPALAGTVLPFGLVLYLGLKGGGYDAVVRSEVGIAAWWVVLLGSLVGVLPVARSRTAGWVALGLLALFALWTGLGIGWSESAERSAAELARVASYLGVFVLALFVQDRDGLRRMLGAVGAAIAVLGTLALLSRLHPAWFPSNETAHFLESTQNRLNYPLNYWNGVAAVMAMGVPVLLTMAARARMLVAQALAAAAVPVLTLTAFYTLSRGGAVEIAVGLVVLLLLYPRRLAVLPTMLATSAGSAILIAGATQRNALEDGLLNEAARGQGDEMLAMVLVVCAGVGLLQVALGLAERHGLGPRVSVPPRLGAGIAAGAALGAIVVALAAGLPGELSDRWQEFKDPVGVSGGAERFESASGNGRYQYWQSALDANATDPLIGTGPGTYEFWWAREGTIPGFVRDAHSLYFETLGEVGIVGFGLLLALLGGIIGTGLGRMRKTHWERRALLAGATAACVVFATAAAIDWVWEIAVIPVVFLLLAAAILGRGGVPTGRRRRDSRELAIVRSLPARLALALGALLALIAIAIPLAGTTSLRESQEAVHAFELDPALQSAREAGQAQPYAATPSLQEALVLELDGDLDAAAAAALEATRDEPTNWRTWLVLSRLEARRGNAAESVEAYRTARSLNPRSPLFDR